MVSSSDQDMATHVSHTLFCFVGDGQGLFLLTLNNPEQYTKTYFVPSVGPSASLSFASMGYPPFLLRFGSIPLA